VNGAEEKGIRKKKAEEIFSLIEKFAQYGFNKSHSTAYAYVAYQTAWLKTHAGQNLQFFRKLLYKKDQGPMKSTTHKQI
jgi:DNA polymerase III alpha subunit